MFSPSTANFSPRPNHHANDSATSFRNPWDPSKGLLASGQVFSKFPIEWAKTLHDHPAKPCKLVKPDFGEHTSNEGVVKATWLGHAGFMVQLPKDPTGSNEPIRILFDPIWLVYSPSDRASPSQMAGPKRRLPPPCDLADLPEFHFVVTSHNHYDHLDWLTVEQIFKQRGCHIQYLVPLGNKPWFCLGGIPADQITEMDWWDEIDLGRRNLQQDVPAANEVRFICTPAQHSSEIGIKHGPFDLAMLPIWRGGSLSFIASMGLRLTSTDITDGLHASPAHAVALHKDIRSRHSLGMHFATFAGSAIEAFEPITELINAKDKENIKDWDEEEGFGTIDVGATAILPITPEARACLVPSVSFNMTS
ncbi:Metallo-hydrolase/oxidoreductase, partial [Ramaria rubella]